MGDNQLSAVGRNVLDGRSPKCPPAELDALRNRIGDGRKRGERCEILMEAAEHDILLLARQRRDRPAEFASRTDQIPRSVPLDYLTAERRSGARPAAP